MTTRQAITQYQNLLLQSQTFSNAAWSKTNSSITSAAITAPDGTLTGSALVEDGTNGTHLTLQSITLANIGIYTASIYVQAGTRTWCAWQLGGNAVYFNLSGAGTIGQVNGTPYSYSITQLGSWYRLTISYQNTSINAATQVDLYGASANGGASYQGVNGQTAVYCWGAQTVQASSPGFYQVTTSSAVNTGTLRNASTGRSNIAQGQNLWSYSQDFTQAGSWTTSNLSVSPNLIAAPDGTLTGTGLLASSTASTQKLVGQTEPVNTDQQITASLYVKAGAVSWTSMYLEAGDEFVFFNLTGAGFINGTVNQTVILSANSSATILNVGNGWYRISITKVRIFFTGTIGYCILSNANGGNVYAASDTTTPQTYIWGAQYVYGKTPGIYTKTTASAINTGGIRIPSSGRKAA